MRRRPAASLVLILTLGLGIGVNAAIFRLVDAALLRPLPFPDPGRLTSVWEARAGREARIRVADGNFADLRAGSESFRGLAAYSGGATLVTAGESTFRAEVWAVTRDFFAVLGVEPALGRLPAADEHGEGRPGVAVVSHGFWRSALGGGPGAVGRELTVYGEPATVVGVLPPGLAFPRDAEVWIDLERHLGRSRTAHNLRVVGRRAAGVGLEAARSEMAALAGRLAAAHPGELGEDYRLVLRPLHDDLAGDSRRTLVLLYGVVCAVLLIACGNVAGILLAQTLARRRELGIRQAMGAGRGQLAAELLTESAVVGVLGGAAGLLFARSGLDLLNAWAPAAILPAGPAAVDGRAVVYSLLLGLLTGLLCALVPAARIAGRAPLEAVRHGDLGPARAGRRIRLGGLLVVAQVAFSLAALVVAGLIVQSLLNLLRVDPGFAPRGVVTAEVTLPDGPASRYAEPDALVGFYGRLLDRVAGLPGVETVSLAHSLPLSGRRTNGLALREGEPLPSADDFELYPDYRLVGAGYFEALGIGLVAGRGFDARDAPDAAPVAIVNQAFAGQLGGSESPVGRRLRLPGLDFDREEALRLLTVVGVVPDVRHAGLDVEPRPAVYVPWTQHLDRARSLHVVAATRVRPEGLVEPVRRQIEALDPGLPRGTALTLDGWLRRSTSEPRFRAGLLSAFAALALGLALLGVYGVTSQAFARRRREVAIRMAVGASRRSVQALLLRSGVRLVVAGEIVGLAAAIPLARLLEGLVFGVELTDPAPFLLAALGLAAAVLLTSYLPARRAGRVDPVTVLKQE